MSRGREQTEQMSRSLDEKKAEEGESLRLQAEIDGLQEQLTEMTTNMDALRLACSVSSNFYYYSKL